MIPGIDTHDEQGMTVIEVILATLITTIIAVPLAMSVFLAIKTIPQSGARSERASERFFLTDSFQRDVANAATVSVPASTSPPAPSANTLTFACPSATTTTTQKFFEATWDDGGTTTVKYEVTFANVSGPVRSVTITRTESGSAGKIVANGLCDYAAFAAASPPMKVVTVTNDLRLGDLHRRVHAELQMSPRGDMPVEITDLEGALGKTR